MTSMTMANKTKKVHMVTEYHQDQIQLEVVEEVKELRMQ
jgi:hypothetical protein